MLFGDTAYQDIDQDLDKDLKGGGIMMMLEAIGEAIGPTADKSDLTCSYGMLLYTTAIIISIYAFGKLVMWGVQIGVKKLKENANPISASLIASVSSVKTKLKESMSATKEAARLGLKTTVKIDKLFRPFNETKKRAIYEYEQSLKFKPSPNCETIEEEFYVYSVENTAKSPNWNGKTRLSLKKQEAIGIVHNAESGEVEVDRQSFENYYSDPNMSYEDNACRLVTNMFVQGACFYACPNDYAFKPGFSPFTFHVDDAITAFWCFNKACIYYSVDIEALGFTEKFCAPGWLARQSPFFQKYILSFPSSRNMITKYAGLTYYVQQYTEKALESLTNKLSIFPDSYKFITKTVGRKGNVIGRLGVFFGALSIAALGVTSMFTAILLKASLLYAMGSVVVASGQTLHYLNQFDPAVPFEAAEKQVGNLGKIPYASTVREEPNRPYAYFNSEFGPLSSKKQIDEDREWIKKGGKGLGKRRRKPCTELSLASLIRICMYADIIYGKQRRGQTIITDGMIEYIKKNYFCASSDCGAEGENGNVFQQLHVRRPIKNSNTEVVEYTRLRNAIGYIVGRGKILFKANAFITVMTQDMELFPAAVFLLQQFSHQLNKLFSDSLGTKKSLFYGETLDVTISSVQKLMVVSGATIIGMGGLVREWVAISKWLIAKVLDMFFLFLKMVPRLIDYVCKRIFPGHAYRRTEDKLGRGAKQAVDGLSEDLDKKQQEINNLRAIAEKEQEDILKMLKELTNASDKVLKETRSSFESLPKRQLQISVCLLKQKKMNEIRLWSKKSLVDLLMTIPPPSKKDLEKRLLNAGLSAKGSRKAMLKRAVEAGLISAEVGE